MEVRINGVTQDVAPHSNVLALLTNLSVALQGIAVAVNGTVVPKTTWETCVLQPNDTITIIKATQGG